MERSHGLTAAAAWLRLITANALHAFNIRSHHGDVTDEQNSSHGQEPARSFQQLADANAFMMVANVVFAGLSSVYAATQSVVVTAVAASVVALVGLFIALSRKRHH
jgi:hypothetical protein